jgi:hypothetical protein
MSLEYKEQTLHRIENMAAAEPFKQIEGNQDHDSHGSMRHVHPSHHLIISKVLHGNGCVS